MERLKKKLIKEFGLQHISIELYLIDKTYTIFQTTYLKDLGLNLSVITDAKAFLDKAQKEKNIQIAKNVSIDALDVGYRIYSYGYLKEGLFLEIGFKDDNIQNSMSHLISKLNTKKTKTRLYAIEKGNGFWNYYEIKKSDIPSKVSFFKNIERFPIDAKKYDDVIIASHVLQKTFINYENDTVEVIAPLYKKDMFDKIGYVDIVMKLTLDISDKLAVLKKTEQVFYTSLVVLSGLLLLIFFFIRNGFTKKVETIAKSIKNKSKIEDTTILLANDEFSFIAKEYNTLFDSLKKEIETNKKLLEENKRFIADTVHQIRTPLTNIMMNSEMIERNLKDDTLSNFTDQINASINMLTNSYEDLAYILSYDSIEYEPATISLTHLLTERVKFFQTISKVNLKSLQAKIEEDVVVTINPIECERLIDNNIANAIKYATPNKPITITLTKEKTGIVLEFGSFGSEITNKEMLFEKNYRENGSKRGLGLGLNMVKIICEKYDISYKLSYNEGRNIFSYTLKKLTII